MAERIPAIWDGHPGLAPDGAPSSWALPSAEEDELGVAGRRMLERGKKEQRETTDAAKRALKVAEQTAEIASVALVEVQRQGQALDRTELGMDTMEKDVKEANAVVRFMRRWCFVQVLCCCDCFDPHAAEEQTRKRRVQERHRQNAVVAEAMALQKDAQQADLSRILKKGDPAYNGDVEAARSELLAIRRPTQRKDATDDAPGIGYGLPPADAAEVQAEAAKQDQVLDRIGTTVESLRVMSMELNRELEEQAPQIGGLADRVETAQGSLGTLARQARKI